MYSSKRLHVPARSRGVINHRCTNPGRLSSMLMAPTFVGPQYGNIVMSDFGTKNFDVAPIFFF